MKTVTALGRAGRLRWGMSIVVAGAAMSVACEADTTSSVPGVGRTTDALVNAADPGASSRTSIRVTAGASMLETSIGSFQLGDQTDAKGRSFTYVIATTSGTADITPNQSGWYMSPGQPQSVVVGQSAGVVETELVGTFVKRADSGMFDLASAYQPYDITLTPGDGCYVLVDAAPDVSVFPGMQVNSTYASGGDLILIQTLEGPKTLVTHATVDFVYLLKEKTWSGE